MPWVPVIEQLAGPPAASVREAAIQGTVAGDGRTARLGPAGGTYDFGLITAKLTVGVAALVSNVSSGEPVYLHRDDLAPCWQNPSSHCLRPHQVVVKYRPIAWDAARR